MPFPAFARRRFRFLRGICPAIAAAALATVLVLAPKPAAAQSNSCFNASNCTSTSSEWSRNTRDRLNIRLQNNCNRGVYVRLCGEQRNGREFCVAEWIRGNGTFNTYILNTTGRYRWREVGSARSTEAWLCANRINGWTRRMF
jgi:hypothetical protein